MRWLAALLAMLFAGAAAAVTPDPSVPQRGAAAAVGALVWLHPSYGGDHPPEAPPWTTRLVAAGWDLWRLDRTGPGDPLDGGAQRLAAGSTALRAQGYRRVLLVGDSRGAFIALLALAVPGVADGVVLTAPAAHGRSETRRAQALEDFGSALAAAALPASARMALVLFADDAWDPNPAARASMFRAAVARMGIAGRLIDRPASPRGHDAASGALFDRLFGACLAAFIDPERFPPASCP
ncbi:alpha/beta fold hydrolase [Plastoroseomonas arctica]|uniref:Uncharacterized protein n=1 Tax=Plastoroseomonas arctica TaxID=1509237 RepID=A0AAF1KPR3_9PROT|nr:hypothetical protein [Plastoroseomonas arctica]MBR0656353.1 hypothetical protein [Plastoroseomonas arctica]